MILLPNLVNEVTQIVDVYIHNFIENDKLQRKKNTKTYTSMIRRVIATTGLTSGQWLTAKLEVEGLDTARGKYFRMYVLKSWKYVCLYIRCVNWCKLHANSFSF